MTPAPNDSTVRFAIPKGRMETRVRALLDDAGIRVSASSRDYRPSISLPGFEVKVLKPRAIVEMLDAGARDLGFAGADWVAESGAELVELLDTRLDPVRLVAAAPQNILDEGALPDRKLVVASEYERLARDWIDANHIDATLLRSYGATEVLPPEDADLIIDNTATGSTLAANNLAIIDDLMTSSTRLYASRVAMDCEQRRPMIERVVLVVSAVLDARKRVMVEVNVTSEDLDAVVGVLPCMREPTIAPLRSSKGYAVKAAVPRDELTRVVPLIKAHGGTDIIVSRPEQIVP